MFIILTGKTASGKDTLKFALLKKYPRLKKVITTTSRAPRSNETAGADYHFLTKYEFESKIKKGDFAEYVEYGGNLYGTQKKELEQAAKFDTLWKIDPSRAGEVREFIERSFSADIAKELIKRILVIYINVSDKVVLQRLQKRHLSEDEIQKRMADDKKIWQQYKDAYDFVVENVPGKLNRTLDKIINIIESHSLPTGFAPIIAVLAIAALVSAMLFLNRIPIKLNTPISEQIKEASSSAKPTLISSSTPSATPKASPSPAPSPKPSVTPISQPSQTPQSVTSNAPPDSGFSKQSVSVDGQNYTVDIIAADLNTTKVIVDTASDSDCSNDCPVLPLADYIARSGAYAGINGSFFCPAEYPSCEGKKGSFDTLLMNKNKRYFNSDNNVYSTVPAAIFSAGSARFISRSLEWGRDTGIDAVIANYPLLVAANNINFTENSNEPKFGDKGPRTFIATRQGKVYIGVVRAATMGESAKVLHALGMDEALNLDEGGSTALWSGRYIAGPGRNIPNAVLFVKR